MDKIQYAKIKMNKGPAATDPPCTTAAIRAEALTGVNRNRSHF